LKLPVIKALVINEDVVEDDLKTAGKILEVISLARGLKDKELDVIGELISNIEGAKIVWDDHRHYGTPVNEAINKFMLRVTKSVKR
jgi:hypothetical protein